MGVRRFTGAVVDRYLDAVRLPVTVVEGAAERVGADGFVPTIVFDTMTGSIREGVGRILGDDELVDEGRRLRVAAEERGRALRLRAKAEEVTEEAEQRFAQRHQKTQREQQRVAKETAQKRERVEERTEAAERAEAQAAARKKAAAREARQRKEKELQRKARDERLEQLDVEEKALAEEEVALTTQAEQLRLGDAAARAKANRKRSA